MMMPGELLEMVEGCQGFDIILDTLVVSWEKLLFFVGMSCCFSEVMA